MRPRIIIVVLLLLSLAACNVPTPTAGLPTLPVDTSTPELVFPPTDTPVPPTAEPSVAPTVAGTTVEFNGVSFRIPQGIGTAITGELKPAVTDKNLPLFEMTPGYIHIVITDYALQNKFHAAQVIVDPIEAAKALDPIFVTRFGELESALADHPADAENLPFMPIFNAAQMFHTAPVYLDFQNGHGMRYLTQFSQAFMPVSNYSLIYTFQGITADGKYHVALILPVNHPSLPADETVTDMQSFADNFPTYIQGVAASLNAAAPSEFTPTLEQLDALAQSLLVQPNGLP